MAAYGITSVSTTLPRLKSLLDDFLPRESPFFPPLEKFLSSASTPSEFTESDTGLLVVQIQEEWAVSRGFLQRFVMQLKDGMCSANLTVPYNLGIMQDMQDMTSLVVELLDDVQTTMGHQEVSPLSKPSKTKTTHLIANRRFSAVCRSGSRKSRW
ncbi:hypothetical protein MW887_010304 [Aspergillus wentii]|nr:hypothetical protein MW887_010304 [Aspergillus wentii]